MEWRGSILRGSTSSSSLLFSESRSISDDNVVCFNFGRLANGEAGRIGGGILCVIFIFFFFQLGVSLVYLFEMHTCGRLVTR